MSWINLSKVEFQLLKHAKLQPTAYIETWPFYRYEYLMEHLKEWNEAEEKRQKEEEKKQKGESFDMKKMAKDMNVFKGHGQQGFSQPKLPNYKL